MNFKDKKKPLAVFLAAMLLITVFLFSNEIRKPDQEAAEVKETASQESEQSNEAPTIGEEEKEKAESINAETTFWFWQGKESGARSKEYLTLRGDGTYILTIELDGRDPEEVAGLYTQEGENGQSLQLWRNGAEVTGEIQGTHLTLEQKRYTKTTCDHL